jgi:hypothetical protein
VFGCKNIISLGFIPIITVTRLLIKMNFLFVVGSLIFQSYLVHMKFEVLLVFTVSFLLTFTKIRQRIVSVN